VPGRPLKTALNEPPQHLHPAGEKPQVSSHGPRVKTMPCRSRFSVAFMGACLFIQASQVFAADQDHTRAALNALGREMSTCSAFFAMAGSVLNAALPDDATTVAARYDAAGKVMLAQASAIADVIGLAPDVVVQWSSSAMREMVTEINADPKNSAALMTSKYDEPCQMLLKDSATRFRDLIDSGSPD
jgi:hypothetical protein